MLMRILRSFARISVILVLAAPSFATLGESLDSVARDQLRLKAVMRIRQTASYWIYEMQNPTGTLIREYVSNSGQVFAVEWEGTFVPELQPLLGQYFEQYSRAAAQQRTRYVGKRPLRIEEPGLVFDTSGHMGSYWGLALDPRLLPGGVGIHEIR